MALDREAERKAAVAAAWGRLQARLAEEAANDEDAVARRAAAEVREVSERLRRDPKRC